MESLTSKELQHFMHTTSSDSIIVDVRTSEEFMQRRIHIQPLINIPLNELQKRIDELLTFDKVFCICETGNRSGIATQLLLARGIAAKNVDGGTSAWEAHMLPMIYDM